MMRIITYNVNGLRAALKKDFLAWLEAANPDILCLQEVKADLEDIDLQPFIHLGYKYVEWFAAQKKGYSGTATFSKVCPQRTFKGMGVAAHDSEGRVLRSDFDTWTLLNCYFPSGTSGELRQKVKLQFLEGFSNYVQDLRQQRPNIVVVGDYNIAHEPMDLHNPESNMNTPGFTPEERAWMTEWLASGWTDAFRHLHPQRVQYSWWSYRMNARSRNKGWRIDYQCVTNNLNAHIQSVALLNDAVHSDHCPVQMDIDF